jgi:predicted nucleic acid-binding protein
VAKLRWTISLFNNGLGFSRYICGVNFFKDIKQMLMNIWDNNFTSVIIATYPVIVQEILQGVVSEHDKRTVNSYFGGLTKLIEEPYSMALDAANLYRNLRKNGVTIRKPNDCLIATFAIINNIKLLENDRNFKMIAKFPSLKLVDLS